MVALDKLSQSQTVCIFAAVKHGRGMTLSQLKRKGSVAGYPICCCISKGIRRSANRRYLCIGINRLSMESKDMNIWKRNLLIR
jgi:hypothetical protein